MSFASEEARLMLQACLGLAERLTAAPHPGIVVFVGRVDQRTRQPREQGFEGRTQGRARGVKSAPERRQAGQAPGGEPLDARVFQHGDDDDLDRLVVTHLEATARIGEMSRRVRCRRPIGPGRIAARGRRQGIGQPDRAAVDERARAFRARQRRFRARRHVPAPQRP